MEESNEVATKLPVTVILPVLNGRSELPAHLDAMERWLADAAQVIVVDGASQDGSLEYVEQRLVHKAAEFHVRDRGLYEAWNFAVRRAEAEFVYFATVGDRIEPGGVNALLEVARTTGAEVVLSPPSMVEGSGEVREESWPIHQLMSGRESDGPFVLSSLEKFVLANTFGIQGLLGSSASNLYRTETLRAHPFPEDAGHAGDTAWGCRHALHVSVAVLPRAVATFVESRPDGRLTDNEYARRGVDFARLTQESVEQFAAASDVSRKEIAVLRLLAAGWCRAREWMAGQVETFAPLLAGHRQHQVYIAELEKECVKRLAAIDELDAEVKRLRGELANAGKTWRLWGR